MHIEIAQHIKGDSYGQKNINLVTLSLQDEKIRKGVWHDRYKP